MPSAFPVSNGVCQRNFSLTLTLSRWERGFFGFALLLAARLQRILPFYYGWVVVGASGTAVFARMAPAITTLTVFIYPMSQELGWSRTLIAGAVSAGALSSMALSPAIGWAIDRFGARPVLVGGVLYGELSPNGRGCRWRTTQHPLLCSQTMRVCWNDAMGWPRDLSGQATVGRMQWAAQVLGAVGVELWWLCAS